MAADNARIQLVIRAIGCLIFGGMAALLTFVLVYMNSAHDQVSLLSQLSREELVLPITMGVFVVIGTVIAALAPRVALRVIGSRVRMLQEEDARTTAMIASTALLCAGALIPGYVAAFMVQDLRLWGATVALVLAPVLLALLPARRRARQALP